MERGVGPARYGDLNSDLPVCISIDTPHNVTCLHIQNGYRSTLPVQQSDSASPSATLNIRFSGAHPNTKLYVFANYYTWACKAMNLKCQWGIQASRQPKF